MCKDLKELLKFLLKSGTQELCSGVVARFGPSEELPDGGHRRALLCV